MSDPSLQIVPIYETEPGRGEPAIAPSCLRSIGFGDFMAFPASRMLTRCGEPVELGGRAFDLLMVLLRSRGALVTRDEIVRYVWPSTTVDESNLRFQMACLRKALGSARDYIKTVPGRGYLFIGDNEEGTRVQHLPLEHSIPVETGLGNGPAIFVIDRDDVIRDALDRLLRSFDVQVASFASVEALLASAIAMPRHADDRGARHMRARC